MHQITLQEAETQIASVLLSEVLHGEEVLIMDREKPVVRMIPIRSSNEPARLPSAIQRAPGSAKGLIWIADDFDETPEDFKDYL